METVVPMTNTVMVIGGCEDGMVRSSRGEDGHDGKATRSCEEFGLRTPTSYTITQYPLKDSSDPTRTDRTPSPLSETNFLQISKQPLNGFDLCVFYLYL